MDQLNTSRVLSFALNWQRRFRFRASPDKPISRYPSSPWTPGLSAYRRRAHPIMISRYPSSPWTPPLSAYRLIGAGHPISRYPVGVLGLTLYRLIGLSAPGHPISRYPSSPWTPPFIGLSAYRRRPHR